MSQQSFKPLNVLCWLCTCLFSTYEMMSRITLGVFQVPIMNELHIHSSQFALLSTTAYSLTAGILQIPVGMLFDRFGFRNILLVATSIGIIGNLALMMSTNFQACMFFRVFSAVGAAFGYLASIISVLILLPKKNHGFFIGLTNLITCLGASFCEGPLVQIFIHYQLNWHHIFLVFSIINVVVFLGATCFPNIKRHQASSSSEQDQIKTDPIMICHVLVISVCFMFTVEYLVQNHGHMLLMTKDLDSITAAYVLSFVWMGYALLAPFVGYLYDKNYNFYNLTLLFCSGFFLSLTFMIYSHGTLQGNIIWVLLFGVFSSGQCLVYPLASKIIKPQYCAILLGCIGTTNQVIIALGSPALSAWVDWFSLTPTLSDYQHALAPLMFVAAVPILIAVNNRKYALMQSLIKIPMQFKSFRSKTASN